MIGQTNAKIGSKINGIVKEYEVNTGNTIAKGDFVSLATFIPSGGSVVGSNTADNFNSRTPCSIGLSNTKMVFIEFDGNYYLQASVGVVNDKTITLQTPVYIQNYQCSWVGAVKIDDTHVFVRFYDNSNAKAMECILTINADNTISVGTKQVFKNNVSRNIKLTLLDTNKILGYYEYYFFSVWYKSLRITTISGDTITNGPDGIILNIDAEFSFPSISILGTNKILITYINPSNFVCARILIISGSNVGLGTEYVIENSQTCTNVSCVKYSDTIAYVFYTYTSDSNNYPRYKKLTISGSNISSGSVTNLTTSYQFPYLGSIQINDTQCCIFNSQSTTRYLFVINILDSALEIDKIASGSGTIFTPRYSLMTPEKLVRSYCAGSNPYTQYTNVITVPTDKIISYDTTIAGVAKSGGSAGETIKVFMPE